MFRSGLVRVAVVLSSVLALVATGCSKKTTTTGSTKPTYTIAFQGPLSGGNQQLGIYMDNAVKLAIQAANAGTSAFGTLPFTLKFEDSDDQGSADLAPTAATKLLDDSSVVAIVGPAFSGATRASEPLLSEAGVASLSPSATAADLTTHGWKNFFRVVANDNIQATADAQYMAKVVKPTSVFVVNDASAYGQPLAQAFATDIQTAGIKVTQQTAPGTTQCQAGTGSSTQYSALASVVAGSGAQALYYGGYYCDLALFAKALRSAGFTGTIMSDDGAENTQLISQAGQPNAQGILTSCACATTLSSAAGQAFDAAYQKLAGSAAGTYSAEAFDAANAIISVMKSISGPITRASVLAGLGPINYPGITKTIKFTPTGDIAGNAVYMYKVNGANLDQLGLVSTLVGP